MEQRLDMAGLLTTSVGSLPKPEYLVKARNKVTRGEMTQEDLHPLELQATREWVEFQDSIGIDIIVDGEQYRGDMTAYFAENWEGMAISGLVRSYGNRYYRKPVVVGELKRPKPTTVDMWRYAQSLTKRPVKGMLTGPYTMMDWSFDEHYSSRRDCALAFAKVIHDEATDLAAAGAKYVQIDEPAISTRPEEFEMAREALGIVTKGLNAHTITHICYGDFGVLYPQLLELPVDNLDLEMKNSNFDLLELFKKNKFTKELSCGVVDVHSHRVESVEEIKDGINKVLEVIPPERLYIDPDCGLKTRQPDEAKQKLKNMVQAVREIKRERGIA
ncbi:MAG: methionine synthase [bacterium]